MKKGKGVRRARVPRVYAFSNRAFGSSSFHLLVSVLSGHVSLIRVILLVAVIYGPVRLGRCMHVSDWTWSAPLCLALQFAQ